jgi:indolepyruvate ferredoxin oxidoreductase beta subunit
MGAIAPQRRRRAAQQPAHPSAPCQPGAAEYPEHIAETLENACGGESRVVRLDARALALEAGSPRSVNVVMLGAMAALTDLPEKVWEQAIDQVLPERLRAVNHRAFRLGYGIPGASLL